MTREEMNEIAALLKGVRGTAFDPDDGRHGAALGPDYCELNV
jgi:hypothetical protein